MSNTNTSKATTSKATKRADSEKPWFRKVKDAWYAWKGGKQVSLGVKGEENYEAAKLAFYRIMSGFCAKSAAKVEVHREPPKSLTVESVVPELHDVASQVFGSGDMANLTDSELMKLNELIAKATGQQTSYNVAGDKLMKLKELADKFLEDKQAKIKASSVQNYKSFLDCFTATFGERDIANLTDDELQDFADSQKWSNSTKNNFLGCVITAFRWAVRKKFIAQSPFEFVQKPPKEKRTISAVIEDDEYTKLLNVADDDYKDFLIVMKHSSGSRPSEIWGLTAEQVDKFCRQAIPLTEHKTSHKGHNRNLVLGPKAWEVLERRAEQVKTGLLWKRQNGTKFTPTAMGHKMRAACEKAGIRRLMNYGFRHTYITKALEDGMSKNDVASFVGHTSTVMIDKNYSHVGENITRLKSLADKFYSK